MLRRFCTNITQAQAVHAGASGPQAAVTNQMYSAKSQRKRNQCPSTLLQKMGPPLYRDCGVRTGCLNAYRGYRPYTTYSCHTRECRHHHTCHLPAFVGDMHISRVGRLRLHTRELIDPSPINVLQLSCDDLRLTDLGALFSVLVDRRPKDPIKALSLESSEFAVDGLDLVSRYLDGNQVLEYLSLADVSFRALSPFRGIKFTDTSHAQTRL